MSGLESGVDSGAVGDHGEQTRKGTRVVRDERKLEDIERDSQRVAQIYDAGTPITSVLSRNRARTVPSSRVTIHWTQLMSDYSLRTYTHRLTLSHIQKRVQYRGILCTFVEL